MEQKKERTSSGPGMLLLVWFLGSYLLGCLFLNLYWRFSGKAAAFSFRISVYDLAVWRISLDALFWQLLRRDVLILSILFPGGLFSWGKSLAYGVAAVSGLLLGMLTSGILLEEGVYWWLRGMVWMLPCFICSGSILVEEMYSVAKGVYQLHMTRHAIAGQLLTYAVHILLVLCLTAMACRVESMLLYHIFTKK